MIGHDNINDLNKITKKQKYNQEGGLIVDVVAKIGEFLLIIVMAILNFLKDMSVKLFKFRPELSMTFPFVLAADNGEALFFIFCWLAMKGGFFLVVFAFGGPLITLIAIVFMYKQLFEKLKEIKKSDDEEEDENKQDNLINN